MKQYIFKFSLLLGLLGFSDLSTVGKAGDNYSDGFLNAIDISASYFTKTWRGEPVLINSKPPEVYSIDKDDKFWNECKPQGGDLHEWGSIYCGGETHTILLDKEQLYPYYLKHGDSAVFFIVAHEFAHAYQNVAGINYPKPLNELHADCLGGMSVKNAYPLFGFSKDNLIKMADTAYDIGTPDWVPNREHGTPDQRKYAFYTGLGVTDLTCKEKDIAIIASISSKKLQRSLAINGTKDNTKINKSSPSSEENFSQFIKSIKTAFLDYLKKSIDPKLLKGLKSFLEL